MFGAILMATNSSFQKGMIFCHSIYVKKVMKRLSFIFEQPSYLLETLAGVLARVTCMTTHLLELNFITLVNVNAPVVATTSWWLHFSAQVVA